MLQWDGDSEQEGFQWPQSHLPDSRAKGSEYFCTPLQDTSPALGKEQDWNRWVEEGRLGSSAQDREA
jgi:hypothetical protein